MVRMERRPTTATLIKPEVLDTRLLGIFDMTTVSREHLLAIKNLVHSTPRCKCKSTISMMDTFTIDCESAEVDDNSTLQKTQKELNKTYRIRQHHERPKLHASERTATGEEHKKVPFIPAPCVTCGRENQPERFHSHPSHRQVKSKEVPSTEVLEQRKTVQKPIPIKFRSAKTKSSDAKEASRSDSKQAQPKGEKSPKHAGMTDNKQQKLDYPGKENAKTKTVCKESTQRTLHHSKYDDSSRVIKTSNVLRTPTYDAYKLDTWIPAPVSGDRKRKVVCSLCSQEFGTALLPSHEAQCIQKYLGLGKVGDSGTSKEGNNNDENQKEPILSSQAKENWKLAWELTQTTLTACKCCGRKFLPNRVEAHQKICSIKSNSYRRLKSTRPIELNAKCYGPYNKWSTGGMVSQHRQKIESSPAETPKAQNTSTSVSVSKRSSGKILKTEIAESADAKTEPDDAESDSVEIFWKAHQAQLVPCTKCRRTFYPHRLEVHMKGCKEPSKPKMKSTKAKMS